MCRISFINKIAGYKVCANNFSFIFPAAKYLINVIKQALHRLTQLAITCSKSAMEASEQRVKSVQS